MIQVTDPKEAGEIVSVVEHYLNLHQPRDGKYQLKVSRDAILREDGWYYVVVQPDHDDVPAYEVSARLTEIELEIEKHTGREILLVPTIPD